MNEQHNIHPQLLKVLQSTEAEIQQLPDHKKVKLIIYLNDCLSKAVLHIQEVQRVRVLNNETHNAQVGNLLNLLTAVFTDPTHIIFERINSNPQVIEDRYQEEARVAGRYWKTKCQEQLKRASSRYMLKKEAFIQLFTELEELALLCIIRQRVLNRYKHLHILTVYSQFRSSIQQLRDQLAGQMNKLRQTDRQLRQGNIQIVEQTRATQPVPNPQGNRNQVKIEEMEETDNGLPVPIGTLTINNSLPRTTNAPGLTQVLGPLHFSFKPK